MGKGKSLAKLLREKSEHLFLACVSSGIAWVVFFLLLLQLASLPCCEASVRSILGAPAAQKSCQVWTFSSNFMFKNSFFSNWVFYFFLKLKLTSKNLFTSLNPSILRKFSCSSNHSLATLNCSLIKYLLHLINNVRNQTLISFKKFSIKGVFTEIC